MTEIALWKNPLYLQTVVAVLLFFIVVGAIVFFLQSRDSKWIAVWASIKSWLFTSPLVFVFAALPSPWPLIFVTLVAVTGAKTFFQMTGMYNRSWFVWLTYLFIFAQSYLVYIGNESNFDLLPLAFFAAAAMIPIVRNSATQMIQYVGLSTINMILIGWGFLHLARIVMWPSGPLIALYLTILFEFSEASNFVFTRSFGKLKPFENITTRFSVEGFVLSIGLTLGVAWMLRHMLPHTEDHYWIAAGLIASVFGRIGGLILSFIRKDLGIKESGIFIIGRDDILSRVDKAVAAAPVFYFVYLYLQSSQLL
jgi:phosphatidate cytidylyltransferase